MPTCSYLTSSDQPCGRPAVAVWEDGAGRLTWMCETCDRRALRVCELDPQWWQSYDRLPLASQGVEEGRGGPQLMEVA
jgi:hypothetical protein